MADANSVYGLRESVDSSAVFLCIDSTACARKEVDEIEWFLCMVLNFLAGFC